MRRKLSATNRVISLSKLNLAHNQVFLGLSSPMRPLLSLTQLLATVLRGGGTWEISLRREEGRDRRSRSGVSMLLMSTTAVMVTKALTTNMTFMSRAQG